MLTLEVSHLVSYIITKSSRERGSNNYHLRVKQVPCLLTPSICGKKACVQSLLNL